MGLNEKWKGFKIVDDKITSNKARSITEIMAGITSEKMPGKFVCPHDSARPYLECDECTAEAKEASIEKDIADQEQLVRQRKKDTIKTAFDKSGIPPIGLDCHFNNYQIYDAQQKIVVNSCKEYTINFAQALKTGRSLVLVGDFGGGKNHLAYSIANYVINKGHKAKFRVLRQVRREIRGTYAKGYTGQSEQQIIDSLISPDLLIIDEIGCGKNSEFGENIVLEIVDERKNKWRPTILLSNLDSESFKAAIGPRCLDRLKEHGGLVLTFTWGSYRSRAAGDPNLPVNNN